MQETTKLPDYEFFPPRDERGAWALPPWDDHIDAALAWQEAHNGEDHSHQWRDPATSSQEATLTMQTIVRVSTLNVALRERLLRIINEMSNIAIGEMSLRKAGAADEAAAPERIPALDPESAQRVTQLARAWFDVIDMAQASMSALTGYAPTARAATGSPATGYDAHLVDRRQRVIHIDFADRRKAG